MNRHSRATNDAAVENGASATRGASRRDPLFGTDYPAEPMESTLDQLPNNGFSREVLRALDRGNAERLFPRLKP